MDLTDRVALVTGGARRLGRAACLALAKAGAHVVVHHGHSPEEAEDVCRRIRELGTKAVPLQADLSDPEAPARLIGEARTLMPSLDILVNNAAVFETGTVAETSLENWTRHLDINLRAPFLLLQAFSAGHGNTQGKVVNISDWRASRPGRKYFAYTISKAGLSTLTQMAARELAPHVQVSALALGTVLPPEQDDPDRTERLLKRVPAGRSAEIQEFTDALLFLLRNDYVTGEILTVDGGAQLS